MTTEAEQQEALDEAVHKAQLALLAQIPACAPMGAALVNLAEAYALISAPMRAIGPRR